MRGCCDCRLLALGQDPLQAVSGARLHHQLLPDLVRAEHGNVSSVTGPSFMVTHAEVEVHLPYSNALLCSTFEKEVQVLHFSLSKIRLRLVQCLLDLSYYPYLSDLSVYFLFGWFYESHTALGAMIQQSQDLSWLHKPSVEYGPCIGITNKALHQSRRCRL